MLRLLTNLIFLPVEYFSDAGGGGAGLGVSNPPPRPPFEQSPPLHTHTPRPLPGMNALWFISIVHNISPRTRELTS